ncbi:YcnI family protein [Microbacterium sp. NPDC056569]|uniref:YcnI family copper-binding membrane protein n=1 Tax=Microbacterium sp. NPDC056569 TaxID=3345867 RepID=UPI003672250E
MTESTPRSSRTRRVAIGVAAGLALAIGAPLAASAHVHVTPETASAGGTETLTFSFSHGCDGSPTTALAIDIPEGVGNATPVVQGGWTITRELGSAGVPTRVVYTADTPVEDGLKAAVAMDVLFTEGAADTTLPFPVTQTCAEGETAWTQLAEDGEDPHDLDAPAPLVAVGAVADDAEAGHGDAAADGAGDASHEGAAADAAAGDAASVPSADPVARWLAAGGLAAGIAALVVVLVRGRRKA